MKVDIEWLNLIGGLLFAFGPVRSQYAKWKIYRQEKKEDKHPEIQIRRKRIVKYMKGSLDEWKLLDTIITITGISILFYSNGVFSF